MSDGRGGGRRSAAAREPAAIPSSHPPARCCTHLRQTRARGRATVRSPGEPRLRRTRATHPRTGVGPRRVVHRPTRKGRYLPSPSVFSAAFAWSAFSARNFSSCSRSSFSSCWTFSKAWVVASPSAFSAFSWASFSWRSILALICAGSFPSKTSVWSSSFGATLNVRLMIVGSDLRKVQGLPPAALNALSLLKDMLT